MTLPLEAAGSGRGPQRTLADAEADFLAFHVAARLRGSGVVVHAHRGQVGIATLFAPVTEGQQRQEDHEHRDEDGPPLARVMDHGSERVA